MYFQIIANRTRELKETKEGFDSMCMAMEKEKTRTREEANLISVMNLLDTTGWDVEKSMTMLKIPISDRPLYARSVEYAISRQKTSTPSA